MLKEQFLDLRMVCNIGLGHKTYKEMSGHNCRVCGFYIDELPWGLDGNSPTYEICPCCGVEFGNEDYTKEATKRYRERWLSEGANWFDPTDKPESWDKEAQSKNIPRDFT